MSEGTQERLRDYLRDTHGLDVRLRLSGAAGKAVLVVLRRTATAKFQEMVAPYMASVDGVQAAAAVPRSVHGRRRSSSSRRSGWCRRGSSTSTSSRTTRSMQSIRHRGRGQPQLLRRRRHGAQLARDDNGRKGFEVLRLGSARTSGGLRRSRTAPTRSATGPAVKVVKNKVQPAVQAGRVRHPLRQGHQPGRLAHRHGRRAGLHPQVRRLVHLRGRAAGPGQGERPHLPAWRTSTWPTRSRRRSRRSSVLAPW